LELTKMYFRCGSIATPPQFTPPLNEGNMSDGGEPSALRLAGVNGPAL
jgi:hypothetical protein